MHRLSALADLLQHLLKWLLLAFVVAVLAGTASAAFLAALDWATRTRLAHAWLIWLLPVAGFAVGWLYLRYGSSVEGGANLLIDEIHDPKKIIPLRMAPLVLGGTVLSHLFGASVGREGTAVQMGGALADQQDFELVTRSDTFILPYRYVPAHLRQRMESLLASGQLDAATELNQQLNTLTAKLQNRQKAQGHSFVSRTVLESTRYPGPTNVLRVVMTNVKTRPHHLRAILAEQRAIGQALVAELGL